MVCPTWPPCSLDADWRLQSDLVPNLRLRLQARVFDVEALATTWRATPATLPLARSLDAIAAHYRRFASMVCDFDRADPPWHYDLGDLLCRVQELGAPATLGGVGLGYVATPWFRNKRP